MDAVKVEREACAQIAESCGAGDTGRYIASRIRARSHNTIMGPAETEEHARAFIMEERSREILSQESLCP